MAITSATIDVSALKVAGDGASKYITSIDSNNGIQVHAQNNTTEHYVQINADGMEVFKDDDSKAFFGETVRIGTEENASITITDSSITGVGEEGKEFFNFGNSEGSTDVRVQQHFDEIQLSDMPYGSQTGLTYNINGTPSKQDIFLYVNIRSTPGGTISETARIDFTLGTSSTQSVSFTKFSTVTLYATFNGVDTITNIRLASRYTSSTSAKLTSIILYWKEATAPAYEIGGEVSATGAYALAEGYSTEAGGDRSHAEGFDTIASGNNSHAEGYFSTASGMGSHAEGVSTEASGSYSHAEGNHTIASGMNSHTQNLNTVANKFAQTAIGKYNAYEDPNTTNKYAFMIGNGTSDNARSNALTVDWSGNVMAQGMAGQIIMFAGSTAPTGWLICDGSAVSRTTYAKLFAVIGTTYGAGDGSTTFNLPDFRGRVPVGVGTGTASTATAHTLGQKAGAETVTLTTSTIPAHTHGSESLTGYFTIRPYSTSGGNILGTNGIVSAGDVSSTSYNGVSGASSGTKYQKITIDATHTHNSVGSGNAHNNMQPYIGINYIIATGKTY